MKDVLRAVIHCHAQNIVIRDIKPDNIMITENNSALLISFGLSKVRTNKRLNTVVGTPYYMSPEVLNGAHEEKTDLWSLGVLLYTLVSGYLPF